MSVFLYIIYIEVTFMLIISILILLVLNMIVIIGVISVALDIRAKELERKRDELSKINK